MKKSRLAALFVGSALVGASLAVAGPATASNWAGGPTGDTGCDMPNVADSANHGYYYSSISSGNTSALNWARTNVVDPTDVNTFNDSLTSTTDVVVYNGNYNGTCGYSWYTSSNTSGIVGMVECESTTGSDKCESWTMRLQKPFTDVVASDWRQALAVHESGHTLGLLHRTSGATVMRTGYPKPSRYFDTHDANHINGYY